MAPVTVNGEKTFKVGATFEATADEHYYDLGQNQEGTLDLKGRQIDCPHHYDAPAGETVCVPFLVTTKGNGKLWGIVWDNPARTLVWPGLHSSTRFPSQVGERVPFFVITGRTSDDLYAGYAKLTGETPLPPKAGFGLIQSKARYETQQELLGIAEGYRQRNLPLDVMVLDWFYWTRMGQIDIDRTFFPDPKGMNDKLEAQGMRSIISVWPRFERESRYFDMLAGKGWLLKDKEGNPVDGLPMRIDRAGALIDSTNPRARAWFWNTVQAIGSPLDFVSLNVYTANTVRAADTASGYEILPDLANSPRMASPWLYVTPEALYWSIRTVSELWKPKTLYISENGCSADDPVAKDGKVYDADRVMYLRNYIIHLHRAVREGFPIEGYFLRSLMDNFEWEDGYTKFFGIHHVDQDPEANPQTQRRLVSRGDPHGSAGLTSRQMATFLSFLRRRSGTFCVFRHFEAVNDRSDQGTALARTLKVPSAGRIGMKLYTLRFAHPDGADEFIQFEAPDLPEALVAAHRHAAKRDAELWDGETRLCAIRRSKKASAFSFGDTAATVAA